MFGFLRKRLNYADQEFSDLSLLLLRDHENPTFRRELLDERHLDFSVDSLKHLDAYLEQLHAAPPQDQDDLVRIVLRCGAYVGEVIRKNSPRRMNWVTFQEASKHSDFVKGLGLSLGTAGILWKESGTMYFPLAKICKFIENGNEDSVYFFARWILQSPEAQ